MLILGSLLLEHLLAFAAADPTIERIYLHVQINNEDALAFVARSLMGYPETSLF